MVTVNNGTKSPNKKNGRGGHRSSNEATAPG
jgi:hypothetical protein